jgi:DNA-binding transcriptional ArsR family regulator
MNNSIGCADAREIQMTPSARMDSKRANPILEQAKKYVAAGLSVIPIKTDGTKSPKSSCLPRDDEGKPTWAPYQKEIAGSDELQQMFSGYCGIAIIGGRVSGNLEVIDFDDLGYYDRFIDLVKDAGKEELLQRLPRIKTPRGKHLLYRCETGVEGNQKLAQYVDESQLIKPAIETRGEGGYVLAVGSPAACHPLNKAYEYESCDLLNLPVITTDERGFLLSTARSLNQTNRYEPIKTLPRSDAAVSCKPEKPIEEFNGGRPGDDFNKRASWADILQKHKWELIKVKDSEEYWKRPSKDGLGTSATVNYKGSDLFYVFSTSTTFEINRGYSKFSVYAILNHSGDFQAAAKELARLGYGGKSIHDSSPQEEIAKEFQPPAHWKFRDLANSRNWECAPLEPIIKDLGIFKGSLIFLAAMSQTGKTLLVLYLIRRMIAGGLCFGRFPVNTVKKLLYLVLEDPDRRIKSRWLDHSEPDIEQGRAISYIAPGFKLNDDGCFSHLEGLIQTAFYETVIIDTYQKATPGISSFNDEQQSVILHRLSELTRKYNVTIIILDHIRKSDNGKRRKAISIEDIKGTGGKAQNADTVILLEKASGKLKLAATSKDLDAPVGFLLDIAPQGSTDAKFTYAGDLEDLIGAQKQKGKENRERILHAIGNDWITREDLERRVSLGRSTVAKHLTKLHGDGILEKKGTGKAIYYRNASVRDDGTLWTQD